MAGSQGALRECHKIRVLLCWLNIMLQRQWSHHAGVWEGLSLPNPGSVLRAEQQNACHSTSNTDSWALHLLILEMGTATHVAGFC